jgi:hypothetical protein
LKADRQLERETIKNTRGKTTATNEEAGGEKKTTRKENLTFVK